MVLIVEDGTGKPNANSFVAVSYFTAYCNARGRDFVAASGVQISAGQTADAAAIDAKIEAALIRATAYLSESFAWQGIRRYGRNNTRFQALAWPRFGVVDREGSHIRDDEIPREILWATCELAWFELQNPDGLQPVFVSHDRVRKERAGPVSIEYDTSDRSAEGSRPELLAVRDLVGIFLSASGGNRLAGRTRR